MPRKKSNVPDPDKLQHYMGVMVTNRDMAAIKRIAAQYGLSNSGAVRLMMRESSRYNPK